MAHLLMLVDAYSGLILDVLISPLRTHDLRRAAELYPHLTPGDVAVADRAYCSYGHVALLFRPQAFVVFRLHQKLQTEHLRRFSGGAERPAKPPTFELLGGGRCDRLILWNKPSVAPQTLPPDLYANGMKLTPFVIVGGFLSGVPGVYQVGEAFSTAFDCSWFVAIGA